MLWSARCCGSPSRSASDGPARLDPLREPSQPLAFEVVDLLQRQLKSSWLFGERSRVTTIADAFQDELRAVLEFRLRHQKRLTSVLRHTNRDDGPQLVIVSWLSRVGTSGSVTG